MDPVEKGKYILSAAKSLKRYAFSDRTIAALLYASSYAGRAGLFASALRFNTSLSLGRLSALASEEGFSPLDLKNNILPWLEASGLVRLNHEGDHIVGADSLILTYTGLLTKISQFYDSLDPQPEDIGCLTILEFTSNMPQPESDVVQKLAKSIGEEKAKASVKLAKEYKIVGCRTGKGLKEPIFYADRIWSKNIERAGRALSFLSSTERAVVLDYIDQVRKYQGMPEVILRKHAKDNNVERLLDLAIALGLLNRTDIQMMNGVPRSFLTSPHFYADLETEFGEDMCDRVKIFLDSTRNGQHFGHKFTGRIADPEILLRKLINNGTIGPCTAIGTDWVTSERAGIVKVRREDVTSGKCYMELVQTDTVTKVLSIIKTGSIATSSLPMDASHVKDGSKFRSIEQLRSEVGEQADTIAEAERAIILKLRES